MVFLYRVGAIKDTMRVLKGSGAMKEATEDTMGILNGKGSLWEKET